MQLPIALGNVLGVQDAVLVFEGVALGKVLGNELGVYRPVNEGVRHMNALGSQFARHALRQSAQRMLGPGKGRKPGRAAHAGSGAGENNRPVAALEHGFCHFAPGQKACECRHFPHLAVDPLGGVGHIKAYIGADVEYRHFNRCNVALNALHQRHHVGFNAGVRPKGVGLAAFGLDLRDQGRELVGLAPGDAGNQPFTCKPPGNGTARGIARTDDQYGFRGAHVQAPA